jgi:hypothetical protein
LLSVWLVAEPRTIATCGYLMTSWRMISISASKFDAHTSLPRERRRDNDAREIEIVRVSESE